jgi:hypothetical protein
MLSATIAAVGVGGVVVIASATKAGSAPGDGEKVFDAPGCQPNEYDGPGLVPHYLLNRDCPGPTAIILVHSSYKNGAWHVTWDGSRSFDPVGERLVRYEWSLGTGQRLKGQKISVLYRHPGLYSVVLYVINADESLRTAKGTVRLR